MIEATPQRKNWMATRGSWLLRTAAILVALALGPAGARADITYNVGRWVGPGLGQIDGLITTDGTLGVLGTGNFVDWSLVLFDSLGNAYKLNGPLSGNNSVLDIAGSDVIATSAQIFFNFSGTDDGLLLIQTNLFSGSNFYCAAASASFLCGQGESLVPLSVSSPGAIFQPQSGNLVIADVGLVDFTPEPGYYVMLPAVLLVLIAASKRRQRKLVS
jgi:hypothetical protein